jgi:hypothetical protein
MLWFGFWWMVMIPVPVRSVLRESFTTLTIGLIFTFLNAIACYRLEKHLKLRVKTSSRHDPGPILGRGHVFFRLRTGMVKASSADIPRDNRRWITFNIRNVSVGKVSSTASVSLVCTPR